MKPCPQLLIVDAIPFTGGSKVSTLHMLNCLPLASNGLKIDIATLDPNTWLAACDQHTNLHLHTLYLPSWLARQDSGILFFIRHLLLAIQVLWLSLFMPKIKVLLGPSGPGVDFCLYLANFFLNAKIIQMIHGPVAASRSLGRCLLQADHVFFLASTELSLRHALSAIGASDKLFHHPHMQSFVNGLPANNYPSASQQQNISLLWAASLLKWKGLDLLVNALQQLPDNQRPPTHICYIRPLHTALSISQAPVSIAHVFWHDAPANLDQIRANSSVFISTSDNEPFGYSILEAMAAGLCVLLPKDGAYWDNVLIDGHTCIKYSPHNVNALANTLLALKQNVSRCHQIGQAAAKLALDYRADITFAPIINTILANTTTQPHDSY